MDDIPLTIDQVSKVLRVAKSTLRYWEKEFDDFIKPDRTEGNRRRYSKDDITKLKRIHYMLNTQGYRIRGARRKLGLD